MALLRLMLCNMRNKWIMDDAYIHVFVIFFYEKTYGQNMSISHSYFKKYLYVFFTHAKLKIKVLLKAKKLKIDTIVLTKILCVT